MVSSFYVGDDLQSGTSLTFTLGWRSWLTVSISSRCRNQTANMMIKESEGLWHLIFQRFSGRNSRKTDFLVEVCAPRTLGFTYFVIVAVLFNAEWTLSHVREVRMCCRGVMQYYQVLAEKWLKANVSCFLMVFNGFSNIYEPQLGIRQRLVFFLHFCSFGKQPN